MAVSTIIVSHIKGHHQKKLKYNTLALQGTAASNQTCTTVISGTIRI